MGERLDGKVAALAIKEELKAAFNNKSRKACLAIIRFNDPASESYLKGRLKISDELGVNVKTFTFEDTNTTNDVINLIKELNDDETVDGIMVDRPLPKSFNESLVLSSINVSKDVDGYTPLNLGNLVSNQDCFSSCTPGAALRILDFYNIDLTGKNALVIGRSVNVGKPLALLLLNKNATVTVAHSKTKNLKAKCKEADIVFLALGRANFLSKEDITENTIIVDIGINFDENGKLCGDANKECYEVAKAYTPVPGGVGVMTNVLLMENLLKAYKRNVSK
ncbi:MAG: bifunctional 5,10-methylenetetrahydrofolate dehydrogenase/5,10-methenyltetrahydrofolate cyclohydrolase [Bacilli bacterium]|nr:bifunctional 5,10-methylenetetrahydrofolate dehydrogenase/5,10-methenyltetrahydrofolate cyclohydrolase [Bacilli bacterium]